MDAHESSTPCLDCSYGWLPSDSEGRPRPCPLCKPHLTRRRGRDGLERWQVSRQQLVSH